MSGSDQEVIVLDEQTDGAIRPEGEAPERVVTDTDGKKTFTLEVPVKLRVKINGGPETEREIASITLRRPTGEDILVMLNFKDEAEQLRQLFTRLSGQPVSVLGRMDVNDFVFTQEVIESFLPASLKSGKK